MTNPPIPGNESTHQVIHLKMQTPRKRFFSREYTNPENKGQFYVLMGKPCLSDILFNPRIQSPVGSDSQSDFPKQYIGIFGIRLNIDWENRKRPYFLFIDRGASYGLYDGSLLDPFESGANDVREKHVC